MAISFDPDIEYFIRSFRELMYSLPRNVGIVSEEQSFVTAQHGPSAELPYFYSPFSLTIVFQVHLTLRRIVSDHRAIDRSSSTRRPITSPFDRRLLPLPSVEWHRRSTHSSLSHVLDRLLLVALDDKQLLASHATDDETPTEIVNDGDRSRIHS